MKRLIPLLLLPVLFSCSKQHEDKRGGTETIFVVTGSNQWFTRATASELSLTDIYVWEGSTLIKHQQSTDTDFGSISAPLTYGSHTLTFVASSSDNQSWASGVWSTTHIIDIFANKVNINIDGSSSTQQIELSRRSSRIKFLSTDNIPTNVKTMHLTVANHKSLSADLKGGSAYTHEATVDITSKQGSVFSVFVNTLTESATDEEDCAVMVEFLDANDNILYHYERTVKLKSNRCLTLKGEYFSGASNAISITSTDWDNVEQALFE